MTDENKRLAYYYEEGSKALVDILSDEFKDNKRTVKFKVIKSIKPHRLAGHIPIGEEFEVFTVDNFHCFSIDYLDE